MLHALSKIIYSDYQENTGARYRVEFVQARRNELSNLLTQSDNWLYMGRSVYPLTLLQHYPNVSDYSQDNSVRQVKEQVPLNHLEFLADAWKVSIYLVELLGNRLRLRQRYGYPGYKVVIILKTQNIYEPVVMRENEVARIIFDQNQFINSRV